MADLRCVVCEGAIARGAEVYANAWEQAAKERPCCGNDCAARFHPDVHWLPCRAPSAPSPIETDRLLSLNRARLKNGDDPAVIAKDLLSAGVPPSAVRKLTRDSVASARATDAVLRHGNAFGAIAGFFTGHVAIFGRKDATRIDATSFDDSETVVAAWIARFGLGDE